LGETRGVWEKVAFWSTKAAISLKRVKIKGKFLWKAYRNSPTIFRMVPSPTLYGLLFLKIGVRNPHPKLQSLLSQERMKLRTSNLAAVYIQRVHPNKGPLKVWRKRSVGVSRDYPKFLSTPII